MVENDVDILKAWLRQNNMSVEDLAEKLNVSKQAIYKNYPSGKIPHTLKEKIKAAGYDVFSQPKVVDYRDALISAQEKIIMLQEQLIKYEVKTKEIARHKAREHS